MTKSIRSLSVLSAALLAIRATGPALAEETRPAASPEKVATEPSVEPAVEPADKPAVKPAEPAMPAEAAKPAELPAKPAELPTQSKEVPAKPQEKELAPSIRPLTELAKSYQQAAESMWKWLREASDGIAATDENVAKLQGRIQDNEAAITKLKIEGGKDSRAGMKDAAKENKQLWRELDAAKAERAALSRSLSRAAAQKVRELNAEVQATLAEVQGRLK